MAGNDVFLYSVPSDADSDDVRLRDPTTSGSLSPILGEFVGALGTFLLSSTGRLKLQGAFTDVLSTLSLQSGGKLKIKGNASNTLFTPILNSTGRLTLKGTLTDSLASLSLSSSGKLKLKGNVSSLLGTFSLTSTGVLFGSNLGPQQMPGYSYGGSFIPPTGLVDWRVQSPLEMKEEHPSYKVAVPFATAPFPWIFAEDNEVIVNKDFD